MNSINKTARMAGFLYLIYMVTHIIRDVWRDRIDCTREMPRQQPVTSWLCMAIPHRLCGRSVCCCCFSFWQPGLSTFYSNR